MRILILLLIGYSIRTLNRIQHQTKQTDMKVTEAVQIIGQIEVTLGRASGEITKLIDELRTGAELPPETAEKLTRIRTIAENLDNIVPDEVTPEGPAPVITDPVTGDTADTVVTE